MRTIFCNIGWLRYYNGEKYLDEYEKPINGGSFNDKNVGHEIRNFKPISGYCYGFVQPPGGGATLHHDTNFGVKFNSDGYIDQVRVIWIANANNTKFGKGARIIGWYNDARAYGENQVNSFNNETGYFFTARSEDCFLLNEIDRTFYFKKNIRNTWYVSDERQLVKEDSLLFRECIEYIDNLTEGMDLGSDKKPDPGKERVFVEGELEHISREQKMRNNVVVARAKEAFANSHKGELFCEVCGFNFYMKFGKLGFGFIEAHHIVPFAKKKEGVVRTEDFKMVCANCHRMLHRKDGLTVEALQAIIAIEQNRLND